MRPIRLAGKMTRHPEWNLDGIDWPNREFSHFIRAGSYNWHVQQIGNGPVCLMLHGTGSATHSWRDLIPLLADHYTVVALDLPGHGFTKGSVIGQVTLQGMAASVALLLKQIGLTPALIVGHSAGVAIGAQLLIDRAWTIPLIGFTPALLPFPGLAARLFPQLAKMLFTNPFVAIIFSRMAQSPGQTAKFLTRATGSKIDSAGDRYYTRLFSKSGHCDGAIRMMANWRLENLRDQLPTMRSPTLLIRASQDAAIPKAAIEDAAALIPDCTIDVMERLGHLAHEEDPNQAAESIVRFAKKQGIA
jgi:magnesium chelatase accessory protein